ncbi:MAG: hypothetical protein RJA99_3545 [Pseudomonadota bacterium]|jgi:DNA repair photolyase
MLQPVTVVRKGRGAVSSPAGRFEADLRERVDDGWPADDDAPPEPVTNVVPDAARSIVSRNRSPDIGFDQSINPYRSCEHGCVYCYARPGHAYLGLSPGLDFETKLFAKLQAPALLHAELAARGYRPDPIAVGAVTDAWQPVERRLRLTRGCLEVLARARHPLSLVTKSAGVERDLDLLAPMAADGLVHAMVTVTTLDPALSRTLEPRAPAPWRRLETIRRIAAAGVPVGVSLAPVIPFVNEPEIEAILEAARDAGASFANYVVLRLPNELVPVFHDWLGEHLPERRARVVARLREMRGGRDNDPRFGWRMKGQGPWADMIRMRFRARARRLGLDAQRPSLRTDLFVPPPGPAAARGSGRRADPPSDPCPGAPVSVQGSLF